MDYKFKKNKELAKRWKTFAKKVANLGAHLTKDGEVTDKELEAIRNEGEDLLRELNGLNIRSYVYIKSPDDFSL